MGACQARRRPARERRCSPTVIINLRPGHLREPGQPRPCRLPFYVPVLSTAENGAHRSPGARTKVPVLSAPGYPLCPPAHGGSPSLESARQAAQQVRGCGQENAHAQGRVHNLTRALGHFRSRPRAHTHTARAAWWVQPETLSPRASFFPQGFQSSHAQLSNFP